MRYVFLLSTISLFSFFSPVSASQLTVGCDSQQQQYIQNANTEIYQNSQSIFSGIQDALVAREGSGSVKTTLQLKTARYVTHCINERAKKDVQYQCQTQPSPDQVLISQNATAPATINIYPDFWTFSDGHKDEMTARFFKVIAKRCGAKEELNGLAPQPLSEKPWGILASTFQNWSRAKAFCIPGENCGNNFATKSSSEASPWNLKSFEEYPEAADVLKDRLQEAYYRGIELLQEVQFTEGDANTELGKDLIQVEGVLECALSHLPQIQYQLLDPSKSQKAGSPQSRASSATLRCSPQSAGQLFNNCQGPKGHEANVQIFPNFYSRMGSKRQMSTLLRQAGMKCNLVNDENQFINKGLPPDNSTYRDRSDGQRKFAHWKKVSFSYEHWMIYGFCIPGQTCTAPQ